MVGRRGQFFIVDAIIASVVLLIGLFYLFGTSITIPGQDQPLASAEDFSNILTYEPLSQSTNTYYTQRLLPAGLVPGPDVTPLEEIAYLVFSNGSLCPTCFTNATAFSQSMMDESLDPTLGASISVNGTLVYARSLGQVNLMFARPTIVYVQMNSTTLIGPVIAEVRLWY